MYAITCPKLNIDDVFVTTFLRRWRYIEGNNTRHDCKAIKDSHSQSRKAEYIRVRVFSFCSKFQCAEDDWLLLQWSTDKVTFHNSYQSGSNLAFGCTVVCPQPKH